MAGAELAAGAEEVLVGVADLGPFGGVAVVAFGDAVEGFAGLDGVGARGGWRVGGFWRGRGEGGNGGGFWGGFFVVEVGDVEAFGDGLGGGGWVGRDEFFGEALEAGDFAFAGFEFDLEVAFFFGEGGFFNVEFADFFLERVDFLGLAGLDEVGGVAVRADELAGEELLAEFFAALDHFFFFGAGLEVAVALIMVDGADVILGVFLLEDGEAEVGGGGFGIGEQGFFVEFDGLVEVALLFGGEGLAEEGELAFAGFFFGDGTAATGKQEEGDRECGKRFHNYGLLVDEKLWHTFQQKAPAVNMEGAPAQQKRWHLPEPDAKLSVIMPAYRLAATIGANIDTVCELLAPHFVYEVVVVDDCSQDGTAEAIAAAAAKRPGQVKGVYQPVNLGKGEALRKGFANSTGEYVLLLDGDLDLSPVMLPHFFRPMRRRRKPADIVIGSKRHRKSRIDYPFRRRFASWVYYTIVRVLFNLPVTDTQTGMKLFKREALQWAFERMLVKRFAFDLEMLAIAAKKGYRVVEAPIKMNYGEKCGSLTAGNVHDTLIDTLAIFYRLRILKYYDSVEVCAPLNPPPKVSVVIACPADSPYLRECLAGLATQTHTNLEAIVLPDHPLELPPQKFSLCVIPTGQIRPAEKRNLGIAAATGDIVAFIDDDTIPTPGWLVNAVKYFSNPTVGATGGPGIDARTDTRLARLGGRVYANRLVSGSYIYRYISNRVRDVDDLPSCNLLVRAALLREFGGFRTDFWPGEDTLLCLAIRNRGLRIVYDPWAIVEHHRRELFAPHLRQVGRYAMHRGYFAKRFPQNSLYISYLIPSLFLIGLLAGPFLSLLHPWLARTYATVVSVYLLLTLAGTFHRTPSTWFLTWFGVIATHLVYGFRFLQGLLSRRMPCEVAAFDHPADVKIQP